MGSSPTTPASRRSNDPSNAAGIDALKEITTRRAELRAVKSFTDSFDTFGDANQFAQKQVGAQVANQWYPNVLSASRDRISLQGRSVRDAEGPDVLARLGYGIRIPAGAKTPPRPARG